MLKGQLIHPEILEALGSAGHGSQVLITDGNYPNITKLGPNAQVVWLNLAPGMLGGTDVLKVIAQAIPIESAYVMETLKTGPYAMSEDPEIWADFQKIISDAGSDAKLEQIERQQFYVDAGSPDVALTIATGEQRIYANLLLTIGVVQ